MVFLTQIYSEWRSDKLDGPNLSIQQVYVCETTITSMIVLFYSDDLIILART